MSKKNKALEHYAKWWIKEDLKWGEIGISVISRPTETEAFRNMNLESNYIRNLSKWELDLTEEELYVYKLDQYVNSIDLDYSKHKGLYRKDNYITKISKLSGYSEDYVNKILKNITRKVYLKEVIGITNSDTNKSNYYSRRKYFRDKLRKYTRVY